MSTNNVEWGHFSKDVRRRYLSPKAGVGQTKSRISRQTMRTPPANPDLQSPPSNPAQGTGPGHVNRGGSGNRDRGAEAGVTHHCGVVKEHAATADEEPSLKKPPETVRRNSDFAIPIDVGCVSFPDSNRACMPSGPPNSNYWPRIQDSRSCVSISQRPLNFR